MDPVESKISRGSTAVDDQHGPVEGAPSPTLTKIPKDTNYGYRPFPPSMKLYMDVSKGIPNPLKCMKLCGPTKMDVLYFVDPHVGKALRGPLRFDKGLCLLNGPNNHDPSAIVAGAGELDSQTITTDGYSVTPRSLSESCRKSVIMMPALNPERNRQEMVEKIMYADTTYRRQPGIPYHGCLCFRFSIEIGLQRPRPRAEFEWVAVTPSVHKAGRHTQASDPASDKMKEERSHFILLPVPPPPTTPSATAGPQQQGPPTSCTTSLLSPVLPPSKGDLVKDDDETDADDAQVLAELVFSSAWSCDHLMTLNLKGAGLTGELGDRWTLMVVMTALRINYLRREGRTNSLKKARVWFKEKFKMNAKSDAGFL